MNDFLNELQRAYPAKAQLLASVSLNQGEAAEAGGTFNGFSYDPQKKQLTFSDIPSACRGLGYIIANPEAAATSRRVA